MEQNGTQGLGLYSQGNSQLRPISYEHNNGPRLIAIKPESALLGFSGSVLVIVVDSPPTHSPVMAFRRLYPRLSETPQNPRKLVIRNPPLDKLRRQADRTERTQNVIYRCPSKICRLLLSVSGSGPGHRVPLLSLHTSV